MVDALFKGLFCQKAYSHFSRSSLAKVDWGAQIDATGGTETRVAERANDAAGKSSIKDIFEVCTDMAIYVLIKVSQSEN